MKACAQCGRLFPDDGMFCPVDGEPLRTASQVPTSKTTTDARIGRVVAKRYQMRRVVADGGMGRVYEALDLKAQRSVAVKVLHPEVAANEIALARFKREFDVSSELRHDHIVEVIEFTPSDDGSYCIVMEFLYGEELRATLKRSGVLPPGRLVRMMSQLALALDAAHARRLVHRDLKPDNIFLCQTGDGDIVKILDFGSVRDNAESAARLTVLGTTIGSPFYMAPEQAQALDSLDHRADVWALAAILYESMTGKVAFTGNNGPSILLAILTAEPTPPSRAALGKAYAVPETVDRVIEASLKKNPALRISSAGELADAFGAAYGLTETHQEWATLPEEKLQRRIDLLLPEILEKQGPRSEGEAPKQEAAPVGPEYRSERPKPAAGSVPPEAATASSPPRDIEQVSAAAQAPSRTSLAREPVAARTGPGAGVVVLIAALALILGVVVTLVFAR